MATNLLVGDIAIVHYASDDPDAFSFVFLRDVEAGTTVNFTDNGWLAAGGFRPGEGIATYTAPTNITAGTVITVPTGSMSFDSAGDQIIAYQGPEASPTLLYAVDFADGNNTFDSDATSATTSALPTGLTLGVTALAIGFDNATYTGPNSGTQLDLLEAIGEPAFWAGHDIVPQPRGPDLVTFDRPTVDLDFDNSTHIGRDYETSVARGGPAVQIADTDVRVDEGSGLFLTSMTIRVIAADFGDQLTVSGALPFGITASFYNPFTGSLTLSGLATSSAYQDAIRQIEFSTTDGPVGSAKRVQVTAFDGANSSFEANAFVHIALLASAAAPVLDLDANNSNGGGADYTATYTAGGPGTPIADVDVSIIDTDSLTLQSARIAILSWALQPGDVLSIAGSLPSGITASSYDPLTGVITLSGTASLADYQTALRRVVYSSSSPAPSTGDRGIQVVVNDGGSDSNIATTYMHVVIPQNVPPVLNLDADSSTTGGDDYLTTFTDGGPPVAIVDTDVLIIDSDSPTLASATVTLTNPQTDDLLVFNGTPPVGISVSGSGTAVIILTGSASPAAYQTALRQITFNNTGTNPTSDTRVIGVVVNDGTADSNVANAIVEVVEVNNSAPLLDLDQNNSTAPGTAFRGTFTENGAPVPIGDDDTLVTDSDSTDLASATITLTNPRAGDLLTVSGTLPAGIEASAYDPVTGVLTLTTVSGPRTLADYETALEQVRFSNDSDDPGAGTRVLQVVVNDGINDGDAATALITVVAVNDAPLISVDTLATYVENVASVVLSPSAILGDPDDAEFTFAAVQITDGSFSGDGDELSIGGLTSGTLGNITFEWDPVSHALVMTGAETVGLYQLLLQSVAFRSSSDNPTDANASPARSLSWTVSDGTTQTTVTSVLDIVALNDAPVAAVASTASYTENGAALTISPAAAVTDPDNFQLAAGQITIISGASAGDVLTVNGLESGTFNGINFSYDAGLHSLLFRPAAPVADYQGLLQAVQFHSTSENPTNSGANPTRTLSWTLFDGRDVSVAETTTLTVSAVNDAPVAQGGSAVGDENTTINGTLVALDVDSPSLTYRLGMPAVHGIAVVNADGSYTYTPNQDFNGIDSFTFIARDGSIDSNTATISLVIAAGNGPPVAQDGSGSGDEDTTINGTLVALDIDSPSLTFRLGTPAANGIAVVNPDGSYTYTPNQDFNGTDSFTFIAGDGSLDSDAATISLAIAAVNDAPVNAVPGALDIEANTSAAIAGLSVADVDAGASVITTTLSVAHGTLTVAPAGEAVVSGSGTGTVTLTGTVAQIDMTMTAGNVVYRAAHDYFDSDTLTMTTNDGGNTGSGGTLSDTDHVAINLQTHLTGTLGDDSVTALPGNARIDALDGIDTITFGFKLVDATVTYSGNKVIIDGPGSHTVLTGFETYVFTDGTVNNNDNDALVDDLFYYSHNHDVWTAHADADTHYHQFGWHEGRDPDAFFSTAIYLSANPDVEAAGVDPLIHFDQCGWHEGRVPSLTFDPQRYLAANPDVMAADVDPLAHFLRVGGQEGRQPFAPTELIAANGFDYVYYLQHNPEVAAGGIDPFQHYETTGWHEGRNPNALFDNNGYLATYTDVAAANINPLDHYHQFGWTEGRDPSVDFDTTDYLAAYPDVAAARIDPLQQFLAYGINEGRSTFADGHFG